ncbi:uncharacterized protein LOC106673651 isoform X2 [Cimex lectularius]|uniref:Uncharacterized protein n=1 Tax=Cimex lectularius TaxID=79782 RepID=A0A8I6SLS7_CIMLE|nr:uncharacterized protein LOC106673651 isoform X2 [Cimex lectularius]
MIKSTFPIFLCFISSSLQAALDPKTPVSIVHQGHYCSTGILLTPVWLVTGNWRSCFSNRTNLIYYADLNLIMLDQIRRVSYIEEYTGLVSESDPLFPDLKIIKADREFNLVGQPAPLNVGLLCAKCVIVYYPKTGNYTEREFDDYYYERLPRHVPTIRMYNVTVIHHITCRSEYKFALFENVVCVTPHDDTDRTPKGAALYCMDKLFGLKYRSVFVTEERISTMELYFGLGEYVYWLRQRIPNLPVVDEVHKKQKKRWMNSRGARHSKLVIKELSKTGIRISTARAVLLCTEH